MTLPRIGLYSISVRGLTVPDMLNWAASHDIPFVHLRGGPRGVDLASQSSVTVWRWRKAAAQTVPITGVTADVDLADLLTGDASARRRAAYDLEELAEAATILNARWVRLPARTPLTADQLAQGEKLRVLADSVLPLLIEPHHPGWVSPATLRPLVDLVNACPKMRLLADTAQLAAALPKRNRFPAWLAPIFDHAQVLHLSDPGTGLDAPGQAVIAALAAYRIQAGQDLEVALEWTGPDRSPDECLARYHATATWWERLTTALESR
ncbi:hypothetical protein OG884_11605 [Streptosporangium sp. NBC_01755]|uniref:sugar phosphate isomerase/epimerase family protein n=1 Tax=Streptosporangium sp. NBC_01755 TaxID=2975949 RepID=UPI002DD98C5B|nr:hypothetical protein [Streptosporangium sp. NBC_01755]WSD02513.1 hypothetical protein OG884_11605 [Streptosporangium sp. NBC_01755]